MSTNIKNPLMPCTKDTRPTPTTHYAYRSGYMRATAWAAKLHKLCAEREEMAARLVKLDGRVVAAWDLNYAIRDKSAEIEAMIKEVSL